MGVPDNVVLTATLSVPVVGEITPVEELRVQAFSPVLTQALPLYRHVASEVPVPAHTPGDDASVKM